ncbi:hypothetical protein WJX77_008138 [Trebouxia sp. C0004]
MLKSFSCQTLNLSPTFWALLLLKLRCHPGLLLLIHHGKQGTADVNGSEAQGRACTDDDQELNKQRQILKFICKQSLSVQRLVIIPTQAAGTDPARGPSWKFLAPDALQVRAQAGTASSNGIRQNPLDSFKAAVQAAPNGMVPTMTEQSLS